MNRWSKTFLIALRLAIGWHFLYEGLWKINSDTGSTSYAAAWYPLQTSVARLHDFYAQGPALQPALARADGWYDDIVKTFKGRNHPLDEGQKARLADLRDKVKLAAYDAAHGRGAAADAVNFDWVYVRDAVLGIAAAAGGRAVHFPALPATIGGAAAGVVPRAGAGHGRHRAADRTGRAGGDRRAGEGDPAGISPPRAGPSRRSSRRASRRFGMP